MSKRVFPSFLKNFRKSAHTRTKRAFFCKKGKIWFFVAVGRKMREKKKMRHAVGRKSPQKRNVSKNGKGGDFQRERTYTLWKTLWKLCKTPLVARVCGIFYLQCSCAKATPFGEKMRNLAFRKRQRFSKVRKVFKNTRGASHRAQFWGDRVVIFPYLPLTQMW